MGITMREKQTPLLTVTTLKVGYPTHQHDPLFTSLNLSLLPGALVCFMGPNGVGKSTLLRTLAGLQKPLEGMISFSSQPTSSPRKSSLGLKEISRKIAVVLTDKISAGSMTAQELIVYGRYPHLDWSLRLTKADEAAIQKAMEATHVLHLKNKKLYELSDGQLQMVMIARALCQETPIILLDEPTAHLDLNNRVEIMNLLRTVARKGNKAILLATHELDLALQTADQIWLAGKNKQLQTGIPEDLVLSGAFDEIFQLKGFDLKTGKVQHEAWRGITINLVGEGPELLWTKNALERCGYRIEENGKVTVHLRIKESKPEWVLDRRELFHNLNTLLNMLSGIGKD